MIFGIVERGNDRKNILGLLLSINLHYIPDEKTVCFLSCSPDTKNYINSFPFNFENIEIVYFLFAKENKLKGMDKFFNIMYTAISKYGECCFIDTNLLMMEKFEINNSIKEKGIGIVKYKSIRTHVLDKQENVSYSAQILYLNNIEYIDAVKKYYEDDEPETDISSNEIDISYNNSSVSNTVELIIKDISRNPVKSNRRKTIPVFLKDTYNIEEFFETYTLIDINEFTAFENEIKPEELTSDFKIGDKSVNFVCLNCNTMSEGILNIYRQLISKAANKALVYMNIINLKKSFIPIIQPKRKGVYMWSREQDPSGMYQLTNMIGDNEFFKVREEYEDYFVVGNNILMDKDSDYHISNRSAIFNEFYLCNYSKKLTDALDSIEKPYQFFAYYCEYPKILEEFTKDKTFEKTIDYVEIKNDKLVFYNNKTEIRREPLERKDDYESFLHQLKNVKFGECNEGDIHLIATYLSLNIVPVIKGNWLLDLEEDIHFVKSIERVSEEKYYESLVVNIEKYVISNIKTDGLLKKLLSKILVRHV